MATSVTVGSSTLTLSETLSAGDFGNFSDGPGWFYVPAGTVAPTTLTPAATTDSGADVNGAMLNPPVFYAASRQGFDGRSTYTGYDAAENIALSMPATLTAGDVIWKAVYQWVNNSIGQARFGMHAEMNLFFIVDWRPAADEPAPCGTEPGQNGTLTRVQFTADPGVIAAGFPSRDFAALGIDYRPVTDYLPWLTRFNPGYGIGGRGTNSNSSKDYQQMMLYTLSNPLPSDNYGRNTGSAMLGSVLHLTGNVATAQQKEDILRALITHGIQGGFPHLYNTDPLGGNGAHHQVHQVGTLLALRYTDTAFTYQNFLDRAPGNHFGQTFVIDQDWIDNKLVPHTLSSLPESYYEHTVQAVQGNVIVTDRPTAWGQPSGTLPTRNSDGDNARATSARYRNIEYSGASGSFTAGNTLTGSPSGNTATILAVDEVTGTTGFVITDNDSGFSGDSSISDGSVSATPLKSANFNDRVAVTIDAQPSPAFAPGDVISWRRNPSPVAGDVDWNIQIGNAVGNDKAYDPSPDASYRSLQVMSYAGALMDLDAWDAALDFQYEYVEIAMQANLPAPENDWPEAIYETGGYTFQGDYWTALWPTQKAAYEGGAASAGTCGGTLNFAITVA